VKRHSRINNRAEERWKLTRGTGRIEICPGEPARPDTTLSPEHRVVYIFCIAMGLRSAESPVGWGGYGEHSGLVDDIQYWPFIGV
jgi:hypothetical protein